ncbi:MAG: hypothetical protein U0X75_06940 [Acidobacteriota bacterium]
MKACPNSQQEPSEIPFIGSPHPALKLPICFVAAVSGASLPPKQDFLALLGKGGKVGQITNCLKKIFHRFENFLILRLCVSLQPLGGLCQAPHHINLVEP